MVAISVNVIYRELFGRFHTTLAEVQLDSSYPADGMPVDPHDFGLSYLDFVHLSTSRNYIPQFDYENNKIIVYEDDMAAGSEVTNGTDLSSVTIKMLVHGR